MTEMVLPGEGDWRQFLALAREEFWRIPEQELGWLQGRWRSGVRALRVDGEFAGLVSASRHHKSGWIGNLIVPKRLRGLGYGRTLFTWARNELVEAGVESLWLTASEQGQPLYEQYGFIPVDRVERWVLPPGARGQIAERETGAAGEILRLLEEEAWGEVRPFVDDLVKQSHVVAVDGTSALLQQDPQLQMIGPWYSRERCPRANRLVLQALVGAADPARELVVDLLADSGLQQLVAAAGFSRTGANALMCYGSIAKVNMGMMMALASPGSIG